jgi:hypothetical protein
MFVPSLGIGLFFYSLLALIRIVVKLFKIDDIRRNSYDRYIILFVLCITIAMFAIGCLFTIITYNIINIDFTHIIPMLYNTILEK